MIFLSRTASMKMENLQEQLINVTAHHDEMQAQLEQSQEQTLQYMKSVENLQMVLEQFQRGRKVKVILVWDFGKIISPHSSAIMSPGLIRQYAVV